MNYLDREKLGLQNLARFGTLLPGCEEVVEDRESLLLCMAMQKCVWSTTSTSQGIRPAEKALESFRQEIDRAAAVLDAQKSFQALEELLELLEDQTAHGEAKVRRLLRRLPKPRLSEEPSWLGPLLQDLQSSTRDEPVPRSLVTSATLLVRHMLAVHGLPTSPPDFSRGPSHSLQVEWSRFLTWLVYPSSLTWPAVHVRVYGGVCEGAKIEARTFRYGVTAVEHSKKFLRD